MAKVGSVTYDFIGVFSCEQKTPMESPRQGSLAKKSLGTIELLKEMSGPCLDDLLGIERVWLLYDFHKNSSWKPKVRPPRGGAVKRGVFATRSPYRPNSIGLSCVKLVEVTGSKIRVAEHDLLDGSLILDIKPYLPYADCFPEAKTGWLEDLKAHEVLFSEDANAQLDWLSSQLGLSVGEIVKNQLMYDPTNGQQKRVRRRGVDYEFSYKTWRVFFQVLGDVVKILYVRSGYSLVELGSNEDPYGDKDIHKLFIEKWSQPIKK